AGWCRPPSAAPVGWKVLSPWPARPTRPTSPSAARSRPWPPVAPRRRIARMLVIDPKTLRKYYREELDTGRADSESRISERVRYFRTFLGRRLSKSQQSRPTVGTMSQVHTRSAMSGMGSAFDSVEALQTVIDVLAMPVFVKNR